MGGQVKNMILQNKNIISLKPGLYFRLAKLKGYSVIDYTPAQNSSCVYSTNCKLDCQLNSKHVNSSVCPQCGEELNLFHDPIMGQFSCKVRVDLLENKFCKLPISQNSWHNLPNIQEQQLSHVQYYKAIKQIKQPQLRECLNNYYNYQIMPMVEPRSYWQDYSSSQKEHYCVYIETCALGNQELWVLVGQDSRFLLQLEQQFKNGMKDCVYENNFLCLLCQTMSSTLFIYQLPEYSPQHIPIRHLYRFQLSQMKLVYSLSFQYQKLQILSLDMGSKVASLYQIENIMSCAPKIQIILQKNQQNISGADYLFPFLYACSETNGEKIGFIGIGKQIIELYKEDKLITLDNINKQTRIDGFIQINNRGKQCFYQIRQQQTKIVIFSPETEKLASQRLLLQDFVFQQANQVIEEDKSKQKIVCQKPSVDGCLYFQHFQHRGKILTGKSCIN